MIKVLNLYAGIGGNRKLWTDVQVTAIENNQQIAAIYQDFFPEDELIIEDAHEFLRNNYKDYDFIWSSPPCPSHSKIRKQVEVPRGRSPPPFPDMELYEEIIFLQHYFNGKWVVENVIGFYDPLIKPFEVGKHYFWSNFKIPKVKEESRCHHVKGRPIQELQKRKGFDISKYDIDYFDQKKILRNCVESELGLHIFASAFKMKQQKLEKVVK